MLWMYVAPFHPTLHCCHLKACFWEAQPYSKCYDANVIKSLGWGICADYRASIRLKKKKNRRSAPLSADLPTFPPRLMTQSWFLVSRDLKIFSQLLCFGCCFVYVWYYHRGCALSENSLDCMTFEILVPQIQKRECVNASYSRGLLRQALSSTAYFSALPYLKRRRGRSPQIFLYRYHGVTF